MPRDPVRGLSATRPPRRRIRTERRRKASGSPRSPSWSPAPRDALDHLFPLEYRAHLRSISRGVILRPMETRGASALVTGAGRGIGRAVARRLGLAGARVTGVARTASELESLVAEIRAAGGE